MPREKGVCLALENHGGVTEIADKMPGIIQGLKDSPWFGMNLDGRNFYSDALCAASAQVKVSAGGGGKRKLAELARVGIPPVSNRLRELIHA